MCCSKLKNGLILTVLAAGIILMLGTGAIADVFSSIGFEASEGYAAPQAYTPGTAQQNIGQGPDFGVGAYNDCYYGNGGGPTAMFAWNGDVDGGTNYGLPAGSSAAFLFNGAWCWSYARTSQYYAPQRPIAVQRQDDRYFTIEYDCMVVNSQPSADNHHIPPGISFWFNGTTTTSSNQVTIAHSKADDAEGANIIWLTVNGVQYNVGVYQYQQWKTEKLVFDKVSNTLTYYYDGMLQGMYPFGPITKWQNYGIGYYFASRDGTIATDNVKFGTEDPNIFSTIDFEESTGYAPPQAYANAIQNIGQGADLTDHFYNAGGTMFAWNGSGYGATNYGVPSGKAAFFYDAGWYWSYARTPNWAQRVAPSDRQNDRYFTIDYSSLVLNAAPDIGNNHIPPAINFWFGGLDLNAVMVNHSKAELDSSTLDIWLTSNGVSRNVGNYVYQQWAGEKLVFDKLLNKVTYYYNDTNLGTYDWTAPATWGTYGVSNYMSKRSGAMATDCIRFGTVVDTSLLPKLSYSDDVTVDGDLNDWSGATWVAMDQIYDPVAFVSEGGDINSASFAAKWGAGGTKVYVAVKVDDQEHGFTDNYTDWFSKDAVELYLHTTGSGGNYGQYQEPAQQWAMGIKSSNHNAVWSTLGYPKAYDYPAPYSRGDYTPTSSEFVGSGREVGSWLYYEAAMTPYQYFASRWNLDNPSSLKNSTMSPLSAGQVVNFDVVAASNDGTSSYMFDPLLPGYRGMASDNSNGGWSSTYSNVPRRVLVRNGVKGKITLTGYSGSVLRAAATVKVYSGATLLQTKNLVLDGMGNYSFENALSGTYTLTASAAGYVSQSKTVTIAAGEASADFTLVKPVSIALTDAKKQASDTAISVSGAITAVFTDYFYIESTDRVTGIRVNKTAHGFTTSDLGKVVNVAGLLKRDSSTQECYIDVLSIETTAGTATILPLALNNKAAVGGDYVDSGTGNGQVGASDGKGLNNVGLLVRTSGRASAGDANGFTLTDGSGVTVYVALAGAGTSYNGKYVIVTGISSLYPSKVRAIRVFRSSDVQQMP